MTITQTGLKAKQHPILLNLSKELRGLRVTKEVEVYGHTYTLALLSPREDDWVAERASAAGSVFEYATKLVKPRLAAALSAIDNTPVAELFQLPDEPDLSADQRKAIEANPEIRADWIRMQVFRFLCEDMDSDVIQKLDSEYSKMDNDKQASLEKIAPLSQRIPSNG